MRRTHGALSTGTALVGLSSNCSEFESPTVCSWKIVKLPAPNAWSNSPRLQPKQRASIFNSPRNVTATPDCPHPPYSALRKSKPSPLSAQVSKATQSANAIRICSRASRRQAGSSPGWEDGTATINPLVPSPCDVAWNSSTQSIAVANSVNPGRCCNEKCESPSLAEGPFICQAHVRTVTKQKTSPGADQGIIRHAARRRGQEHLAAFGPAQFKSLVDELVMVLRPGRGNEEAPPRGDLVSCLYPPGQIHRRRLVCIVEDRVRASPC